MVTPDATDAAAPIKGAGYAGAIIGTAIGGTIVWIYNEVFSNDDSGADDDGDDESAGNTGADTDTEDEETIPRRKSDRVDATSELERAENQLEGLRGFEDNSKKDSPGEKQNDVRTDKSEQALDNALKNLDIKDFKE